MTDTTHTLTERAAGEWELRSEHGHKISKPLTTIQAVTPETAMTRAETWLKTHHHTRRGHRWAKSAGWTRRWALRTT